MPNPETNKDFTETCKNKYDKAEENFCSACGATQGPLRDA
jgi:hypothetical protein